MQYAKFVKPGLLNTLFNYSLNMIKILCKIFSIEKYNFFSNYKKLNWYKKYYLTIYQQYHQRKKKSFKAEHWFSSNSRTNYNTFFSNCKNLISGIRDNNLVKQSCRTTKEFVSFTIMTEQN